MTAEAEVLAQIRSIEGWLSDREALFLHLLARLCVGKGVIVEIGSWKGKSTICLGLGSLAGNGIPVYAIDPHDCAYDSTGSLIRHAHLTTFDEFRANLRKARLEEIVHAIVRSSDDALKDWHLPIELLWIDGDHTYEAVRRDIEGWGAHLVDSGKILLHDSTCGGSDTVRQAVMECVLASRFFKGAAAVDTITYATKNGVPVNLADSIRSRYLLAAYRLFGAARAVPFPPALREPLRIPARRIFAFLREWMD